MQTHPLESKLTLTLPDSLQRAIVAYRDQEVATATARLEDAIAESQQMIEALATDNERQAAAIAAFQDEIHQLHATAAEGAGRVAQLTTDLEHTRTELHAGEEWREAAERALAVCRAEQQAIQKTAADLRAQITALNRELHEAREQTQVFAVQLGKIEGQLEAAQQELARYRNVTLEVAEGAFRSISYQFYEAKHQNSGVLCHIVRRC